MREVTHAAAPANRGEPACTGVRLNGPSGCVRSLASTVWRVRARVWTLRVAGVGAITFRWGGGVTRLVT